MIKINKNIPVPAYLLEKGNNSKYPFRLMDVGDSFLYRKPITKQNLLLARAIASKVSKNLNKGFKCGQFNNTIRIWRTI